MSKDTMPKPDTGVYRRPGSTQWQWRIKVPTDLRSLYVTEWAHRVSLGTDDLREGNAKAAKLRADWLSRFDQQRKELNPQAVERITPELADVLAQRVAFELLAVDEKLRTDPDAARLLLLTVRAAVPSRLTIGTAPLPAWATDPIDPLDGLPEDLAGELSQLNAAMDQQAALQMALQRVSAVLPMAQAQAKKLGVAFDTKTPGALDMLRACLKAYRKARQDIRRRDAGEVVETPSPLEPAPATPRTVPMTLRDVYDRWKGVKKRSKDTLRACERALELYEQRTGNTPVTALTRAQGDDFRAWLQTLGTSSKTAHDRMTWVKSLLVYAFRDLELITRQPWEGLDIDHRTENPRKPWTTTELKAFFSLPLFTRYELPRATSENGGHAAYWIPLIGLYTGARVGELCQLRVQDVEVTEEGAFFRITEEAEGATVKTAAGIRRVPVHPELVRLGFLQYVGDMRDAGAAPLWPRLKLLKEKPGHYFSGWVNPFHKQATGNPQAPVFHELRHTVRTALHSAGVDRATIGLIIGHDTGLSDAELTYTHVSDVDLRKALGSVRYPLLSLPKLYPRIA